MSKIKQSNAVQRQIPEHIRENYPAFVEFVKAYYEFLEQSQAQNLEQIRDVDNTLEEFIDKFKLELAKNVPIELASDKRLLLKHIREFYLARGSEASFEFLFSVLFDKPASLFYPSTQVLRVSDGKWIQETSIFVVVSGSTQTLQPLKGKIITINTGRKTLTTYVSAVNQYSNNIYEVFIESQFSGSITVGSTVSHTEGAITYTGISLQCPTSVSIYKAGQGFKVGDLFDLNTQLGRGCLIKVTKVDSVGAIKSVQILRFGLDYRSTFYSYLSATQLEAIEYIHPIHSSPYVPGQPAYNEPHGGFVDYGWGSKQTYMYYDESIPTSLDRRSDRYYADASYVGEVTTQFYAEDTTNPLDDNVAIIQVNLGAVAKYPGYYMAADGFISDEIYIQDGDYYQSFSYVIRVEEEMRKYADIVKALVHPAGIKMFAEYSIYKELKLSAVSTILSNRLQLPLDTSAPSNAYVSDGGYAYNQYSGSFVNNQAIYVPAPGATKVFKQNKPSLFVTKKVTDSQSTSDDISTKHVYKNPAELISELESIVKHVFKPLNDYANSNLESISKLVSKPIADAVNKSDSNVKSVAKAINDNVNKSDSISKAYTKNLSDAKSTLDVVIKDVAKLKTETLSLVESYKNELQKTISDTKSTQDSIIKDITKYITDTISKTDAKVLEVSKAISDSITHVDRPSKAFAKAPIAESITHIDQSSKSTTKTILDSILTPTDSILITRLILIELYQTIYDNISKDLSKTIADQTYSITSTATLSGDKLIEEPINTSMSGKLRNSPYDNGDPIDGYFRFEEDYQPSITLS